MYRIGIYDDDRQYIKKTKEQFNLFFQKKDIKVKIYEFYEEKLLLDFYEERKYQIDFLFINTMMYNEPTIELAQTVKRIDPLSQIVFWTCESDRSRCYEVEHSYFLYKNTLEKNLDHMFQCLVQKYEQIQKEEKNRKLVIQIRGKKMVILQRRIQYLERNERKTYIYYGQDEIEKIIMTSQKMVELEKNLDPSVFVRCHNSYIININFISQIYREHIILKNDKSVPVSRKYSKDIRECF